MSKVRLYGSTSGYVDLAAPAVADDATLTLPTAAVGFGKTLQVVQTVKTSTFSSTSLTPVVVTGLSATITPSSATSKVLLLATVNIGVTSAGVTDASTFFQLATGGSALFVGDAASTRPQVTAHLSRDSGWDAQGQMLMVSAVYLHSPATTSPVTYDVEVWGSDSGTVYVNRSRLDTDGRLPRGASSLTAIEVAA